MSLLTWISLAIVIALCVLGAFLAIRQDVLWEREVDKWQREIEQMNERGDGRG